MNYLIDTNVISELISDKPNKSVINWFSEVSMTAYNLSVLTFGEIRTGVEKIITG